MGGVHDGAADLLPAPLLERCSPRARPSTPGRCCAPSSPGRRPRCRATPNGSSATGRWATSPWRSTTGPPRRACLPHCAPTRISGRSTGSGARCSASSPSSWAGWRPTSTDPDDFLRRARESYVHQGVPVLIAGSMRSGRYPPRPMRPRRPPAACTATAASGCSNGAGGAARCPTPRACVFLASSSRGPGVRCRCSTSSRPRAARRHRGDRPRTGPRRHRAAGVPASARRAGRRDRRGGVRCRPRPPGTPAARTVAACRRARRGARSGRARPHRRRPDRTRP